MQIIIDGDAYINLYDIYTYIARDSLYFANKTINTIYSYIEVLKSSPYIGHYVLQLPNKHYRELIYKRYRIIYSISENQNIINIRAIIHTSRNLSALL